MSTRVSRLRPRNWPVRWRLAGTSAGLTLAILVLFGAIIGNLAAQRIRDDFNREMQQAVATLSSQIQIIDTITNTLIARQPDLGDFVSPNDATARIFDSHGTLLEASPGAVELGAPVLGVHHVGDMRVVTVTLRSGQTGRVAGYVQYGRDEHHIDSTIDRLWLFIAAGVLGATLLAALAGLAIAGRAMRPISSLTATAREISDTGDPSRNMPVPRTDDEVGELAETLEEMLRSLDAARSEREAAMRKQREFVADASHELRTPLTSIVANLELLQASLEDPTREEDRAVVDSALRSSNRMSRLVADLLLLARADAGRPGARTECDLAEVGGQRRGRGGADHRRTRAADRERPAAADRGQPRRAAPPGRSTCSTTPPATRRRAHGSSCACAPPAATRWSKSSDDGPGIPPELRERDIRPLRPRRGPGRHRPRVGQRPRPRDRPRRRRLPRRQRRGRPSPIWAAPGSWSGSRSARLSGELPLL